RLPAPASMQMDAEGVRRLTVSLPPLDGPHRRLDLYAIVRGTALKKPLEASALNGETAPPRLAQGDEWIIYAHDLLPHMGEAVEYQARFARPGDQPFTDPRMRVEVWLVGEAGDASGDDPYADERLPWAIAQGCSTYSVQLLPDTEVPHPPGPTIAAEELAGIKAAKLRMELFDVNPEERYSGKQILLNGTPIAEVPAKRGNLASWQESILDIAPEHLRAVALDNTLVLTNAGGDCYKVRGMALAVQRADGVWVTGGFSDRVLSSVRGWLYTEGEVFDGDRSPEVTLALPQP
ncbi:MAG TPA: hypothetical protein VM283_00995, partial [Armatimonadota bacterium]|nr:hypothetical protein [Armatimonadota bacterium]